LFISEGGIVDLTMQY